MLIMGIDPGINECAFAIVKSEGKKLTLVEAVLVRNTYKKVSSKVDKKEKVIQMARDFKKAMLKLDTSLDLMCIELTTSVLNHDTLARMAFAGGFAAGSVEASDIMVVAPPTWKDVSDKLENHERMYARMTAKFKKELDVFLKPVPNGKRHNIIDAVGIAIWASKQ